MCEIVVMFIYYLKLIELRVRRFYGADSVDPMNKYLEILPNIQSTEFSTFRYLAESVKSLQ